MEIGNSCRCCLLRPPDKKLKKPYSRSGKTEIYFNMLKECFEIHLLCDDDCGICKVCVERLRDASEFKLQVLRSQEQLQARRMAACHVKEEHESPKSEMQDDYDVIQEDLIFSEADVKTEVSLDPLPTENNEFNFFITDPEKASDVCKQESLQGLVSKHTECPNNTPPKNIRNEMLDRNTKHDIKPKRKRKGWARTKDLNAPYICDTCGKQFTRKAGLSIHKKSHKREAFICEICNKQFRVKVQLNYHRITHNRERPSCCGICHKWFLNRHAFNTHIYTHTSEECSAGISHTATQTGEKLFRCNSCLAKFNCRQILFSHMKKNHYNKTFICDKCKRVFPGKAELISHMNKHYSWQIYSCNICGLTLSTKRHLWRHRKIHTDEKAYSCEMCNKQFRHKHGLNNHILTHTGQKPHCCEICGKQFALKTNLRKHLEIHVEGQIFACELCTKSYSTSEGLRQHRRTHVKVKSQTKSVKKKTKQK